MTKDGIEYNLDITPWEVKKKYNGCILTYKFSSEFYKNKFIVLSKFTENKEMKKLGISIDNTMLSDIKLYSAIEKRGFQIITSHLEKLENLKDMKIKISFDVGKVD
jgi:hypothetical protein